MRIALIAITSFFISSCSFHVKDEGFFLEPYSENRADIKIDTRYFAKRDFSHLDTPQVYGDIEYPPFYYSDSDFYQFYEFSSFDIVSYFKENSVLPPVTKFSVLNIGKAVSVGDMVFICSIISITSPSVSSYDDSGYKNELAAYLMIIGGEGILGAEKITNPSKNNENDLVSICYNSLY